MGKSPIAHRSLAAAACIAAAVALAACDASSNEPNGALVVVVGARNNTPPPQLTGLAMEARDAALQADKLRVSIVVVDGDPPVIGPVTLTLTAHNPIAEKQQRERNRRRIDDEVKAAVAKAPQTDLLSALDQAANSIRTAPGPHTVVVVDSGLSTTGTLNFTRPGLFDADPKELADSLRQADQLPDLSGAHVVFQGLGYIAPPQEKLSIPQRKHLIDIWTAIANAAGADDVQVETAPRQGTPPDGLPPVTPVVLSAGVNCTSDEVILSGGDVAFQPDSDEFLDRDAAVAKIKPIAEQMVSGGLSATLIGTTARVGADRGQVQLSQERAQAVADVLTGLGVPRDRRTAIGLGSNFPGYVQDHDAAGHLIPDRAAQNRKVIITLQGSGTVACD